LLSHPAICKHFTTPAAFVRYLGGAAKNQMHKARETYLDADKRDLRRNRPLSDPGTAAAVASLLDKQPTPYQTAEFHDDWEQWLSSFSAEEQQVLLLLRAAFNHHKIAEELKCDERTIERKISHIRSVPPLC
jgi:DNA-binding NarL/FixJ family response regulator